MKSHDQEGAVTSVVLGLVLLALALVASLAFGYWAYTGRQDYKNNTDQKVAAAVTKAVKEQSDKDKADFQEKEKLPNKTFRGPATYGSVTFGYPKTWSAFVDQSQSTDPVKSLFYPDIVPSSIPQNGITPQYALRVDLVGSTYDQVLRQLDPSIKKGTLRASAYVPPKMVQIPNVQTGSRFDGEIEHGIQGSMIVMKVRDKTMKVYTESPSFMSDFDNIVLSSLTFIP